MTKNSGKLSPVKRTDKTCSNGDWLNFREFSWKVSATESILTTVQCGWNFPSDELKWRRWIRSFPRAEKNRCSLIFISINWIRSLSIVTYGQWRTWSGSKEKYVWIRTPQMITVSALVMPIGITRIVPFLAWHFIGNKSAKRMTKLCEFITRRIIFRSVDHSSRSRHTVEWNEWRRQQNAFHISHAHRSTHTHIQR